MATDASRALLESILGGSLSEAARSETVRLALERRYLPLAYSPVTAVASVTIDGTALDASDYRATPTGLERLDGSAWPTCDIEVSYTTGWELGGEPPEIAAALARADTLDLGVTSEQVGDIRVRRDTGATLDSLRALVRRWVKP